MRGLQITIFIAAIIVLISQTTHFVYVKYFYDTASALDDFAEKNIKEAESLEDLVANYESTMAKIMEYEKGKSDEYLSKIRMRQIEPYKTKLKLERAIMDWESKKESVKKLLVQWCIGMVVLDIGCLLYIKGNLWLGMGLILSGLGEMIWWSSPSLSLEGAVSSFETVLNYKLVLSIISLILVVVIWSVNERKQRSL